jgi:predicted membrane chloride channel (bestrophin family)
MNYTKSNDGWLKTLFVFEGRALDKYAGALLFVTANAVIWTCTAEELFPEPDSETTQPYENFFSLVLSTTLAFLLVFRLNRSKIRFWIARKNWGSIVALGK